MFWCIWIYFKIWKSLKNSVDTMFTRTYYRMKIGGFGRVMGECAGILKKVLFLVLGVVLGCVNRVELLRG